MAKKKKGKSGGSSARLGDRIFAALTQREIANLLDALFGVLPPDMRDKALGELQADTRQTVQHILSPPEAAGCESGRGKAGFHGQIRTDMVQPVE